jgi:nucleotide-binding universal stress UspA family protein
MFEPKKILVPLNFTERSEKALEQAVDIAERYNSTIFLLYVIENPIVQYPVDLSMPEMTHRIIETEIINETMEKLHEVGERKIISRNIKVDYDFKEGMAYNEILKEQTEKEIDLIIMAKPGKKGIISHIIGGVTDKVLRKSSSPVLLV